LVMIRIECDACDCHVVDLILTRTVCGDPILITDLFETTPGIEKEPERP
jgi:hypothetical protein